jgi:2-(1,2-epoxy-1,2-dihydrophenyl)acetyl-CoA isomerase
MFHLLPRVVGLTRAKELLYSARVLPAEEPQALGIVYAAKTDAEIEAALLQDMHRNYC